MLKLSAATAVSLSCVTQEQAGSAAGAKQLDQGKMHSDATEETLTAMLEDCARIGAPLKHLSKTASSSSCRTRMWPNWCTSWPAARTRGQSLLLPALPRLQLARHSAEQDAKLHEHLGAMRERPTRCTAQRSAYLCACLAPSRPAQHTGLSSGSSLRGLLSKSLVWRLALHFCAQHSCAAGP